MSAYAGCVPAEESNNTGTYAPIVTVLIPNTIKMTATNVARNRR